MSCPILLSNLRTIAKSEKEADIFYSFFSTDFFKSMFYFTEKDNLTKSQKQESLENLKQRTNEEGEPLLHYNSRLKRHYFVDKYNEKVYFPFNDTGLKSIFFDNKDMNDLSLGIAFQYFSKNVNLNLEDFEFENLQGSSLKELIENYLTQLIDNLEVNKSLPAYKKNSRLKMLKESLNHIDEWSDEVKNIFNTFKIKFEIEDENITIEEEESVRGDLIRKESFLKDSKNNASNNIKLLLNFLESDSLTLFGESKFHSFRDVYKSLNQTLENITPLNTEDEFELYKEKIEELVKVKPFLSNLLNQMNNASETFKNQFVSAFRLHRNNYLTTDVVVKDNTFSYNTKNISEVGGLQNNILSIWSNNLLRQELKSEDFEKLNKKITDLIAKVNKNSDYISNAKNVISILEEIGIGLNSQKSLDYFLSNQFPGLNQNKALESLLIDIHGRITTPLQKKPNNIEEIFKDQTFIKNLAKAEAFFLEEGSDASVYTTGKTKWVYSLPSYLSNKINSWKKNPELLIDLFLSNDFTESSYYMKYLLAEDVSIANRETKSKERITEMQLGIFNSYQIENNDNDQGVDGNDMTPNDKINDYINKLLAHRKGAKSWHKTNLAADKSTEYQIFYGNMNLKNILLFQRNDNMFLNQTTLDIFYDYVIGEYLRINKVYNEIQDSEENSNLLIPNFHLNAKNGLKIHLFPSFSPEYDIKTGEIIKQPNTPFKLFNNEGKPLYKSKKDPGLQKISGAIKGEIEKILLKNIELQFETLFKQGVFNLDKIGGLQNNSIDGTIWNQFLTENNKDVKKAMLSIAAESFINGVISQVEYTKMFVGDVAYYKNMEDFKKRVPGTYTDGLHMRLAENEQNFNVQVINSIEHDVFYYDNFAEAVGKEVADKYKKTNSADGQAWITPERWEFIMRRLGKWSSVHESAFKKMQSNKIEEFSDKEKKVLGQPLKGVYFDLTPEGKPVFLKYSQAVLWNSLIKNTDLEKVHFKMVRNEDGEKLPFNEQTHELITKDGIKVGYHKPFDIHDTQGNLKPGFDLGPKLILNNFYWKLQQDLPTKGLKETKVGSQIQKIIYQGLNYSNDLTFEYNGKQLSNKELSQEIHDLHSALSNTSIKKVFNSLGLDENFKIIDNDKFVSGITDQLSKRDDVPKNLIDSLNAGLSPYGIPGFLEMFNNVYSAVINSNAIDIKTQGGGFIQMADFGLGKNDLNQNIVYTPWFDKKKLPTPEVVVDPETGIKKVKPAGIFLTGSVLSKIFPDWRLYANEPETLFGKLNPDTGNYEGGKIDYKILQNIIGYRIPNQGLSSNDALQVMGILPDAVGDTIVAYTGITTKTGSDYDIDKMYIMFPSVRKVKKNALKMFKKLNGLSLQRVKTILQNEGLPITGDVYQLLYDLLITGNNDSSSSVKQYFLDKYEALAEVVQKIENNVEEHPIERIEYYKPLSYITTENEVKEYPLFLQPKEALQNKLIEAYKAVLTHPELLKEIYKPLDGDIIKNDITNKFPAVKRDDVKDFDPFSDIFMKNEFIEAKAGLGQNVNNLTHSAVNASLGINFDNYLLDSQYSEELTDEELNYYMEYYNSNEKDPKNHLTKEDLPKLKKLVLADTFTEFINAFVDVAKDSYISRGNWFINTNAVGFLLLRSGKHPFYVNAFIGQPVIKKHQEFVNLNRSKLKQFKFSSSNKKEFIKFLVLDKYKIVDKADILYKNDVYNNYQMTYKIINDHLDVESIVNNFNIEDIQKSKKALENSMLKDSKKLYSESKILNLFDNVVESLYDLHISQTEELTFEKLNDNIKNNKNSLLVFDTFDQYKKDAKKLNLLIKALKVTVNGKGRNNVSTLIAQNLIEINQNKYSNIYGKFNNAEKSLENTALETMYKNSIQTSREIADKNPIYFITGNTLAFNTFNYISTLIEGEPLLDDTLGNLIEKNYINYIMQGFTPFLENNKNKEKILSTFAEDFFEAKKKYPKNKLLNYLYPIKGKEFTIIGMNNNGKLLPSEINDLTSAWNELLKLSPEFAEKMILYSFYQSSFTSTVTQFHKFIPYQWFNKNGFNSYLKKLDFYLKNNYENINYDFVDQFFRNNLGNTTIFNNKNTYGLEKSFLQLANSQGKPISNQLMFRISETEARKFPDYLSIDFEKEINSGEFENDFGNITDFIDVEMLGIANKKQLYRYKKIGEYSINNKQSPIYVRLEALSYKDTKGIRTYEYNPNIIDLEKSSFSNNHLENYKTVENVVKFFKNSKSFTPINDLVVAKNISEYNSKTMLNSKIKNDLVSYYEADFLDKKSPKEEQINNFKMALEEFNTLEEVLDFLNC